MALPFKNGFELAQALGFGKLYQASKEHDDNNMQIESKNINKELIRLTESDLHNIVKEAVKSIIKEYGETPEGQRKLGGLHARKVLRNGVGDNANNIYKYAAKSRGGDAYNNVGDNENPMYKDYANGYIDYLHHHPEEMASYTRRKIHKK